MQKQGFDKKDLLDLKKDAMKLKDLEFLKQQDPPGPFASGQEVKNFINNISESKSKNTRMYREVRKT